MVTIRDVLNSVVDKLSDDNYAESLTFYRLWFDIGRTYLQISSDNTYSSIRSKSRQSLMSSAHGELMHLPTSSILRFAGDVDAEPDSRPSSSPRAPGLQTRLSATSLQEFFNDNLLIVYYEAYNESQPVGDFYRNTDLIAHWANLGYVEEAAIRSHILQSLISHPTLYGHQMDALIILFKLAGATFEAYANPSVLDRCFELLNDHCNHNTVNGGLIQEIFKLRESGWEGLPPPPVFTAGGLRPADANQRDPATTPLATSLGLPNTALEPQIPQPPPPELVAALEEDTTPESPVTQSPSTSITTLSDFTIADASDDESSIEPTIADTSDDEPLTDPTTITPHDTFYLEDGNVEVLCGNTLFRVHTSTLSFHSPALRRMFTRTSLAAAESPNGCPRILSSDTAKDFTTLLKVIYLPGFPERNKVPDFITFSSLLRITTKYEMPLVRSQLLEVIRDAYPETFEGLAPSKAIGERVFSGPTPHPNEVLNLFVQQNLTPALPMAYYMAARRGLNSLMNGHLPRAATLRPEILRSAITGFVALREMELNETHRLLFGPNGSHPCSASRCTLRAPTGPAALEAYQKVFDRIAGSSRSGTNLLQVPEFYENRGGALQCIDPDICRSCVERWRVGHAELRKEAWDMLPVVFGLKD